MHSVQEALVMKIELLPVGEMPLRSLRLSLRSLAVIASPWLAKALRLQRPATPSLPYPTNAICRASLSVSADVGAQDDLFAGGPSDPLPLVLERGCFYFAAIWPIPSTSSKGVTDVLTIIIFSGTNA